MNVLRIAERGPRGEFTLGHSDIVSAERDLSATHYEGGNTSMLQNWIDLAVVTIALDTPEIPKDTFDRELNR